MRWSNNRSSREGAKGGMKMSLKTSQRPEEVDKKKDDDMQNLSSVWLTRTRLRPSVHELTTARSTQYVLE